jgi:outer membrane receptor protein involved in Fe transport
LTNRLDLNGFYNIVSFAGMNFRATILIYNLLDTKNEVWVNSQTGRAYTDVIQPTDISGHRSSFSTYDDVYQNPSMYSTPREIRIGLGITF